jgi:hypothetical protein
VNVIFSLKNRKKIDDRGAYGFLSSRVVLSCRTDNPKDVAFDGCRGFGVGEKGKERLPQFQNRKI